MFQVQHAAPTTASHRFEIAATGLSSQGCPRRLAAAGQVDECAAAPCARPVSAVVIGASSPALLFGLESLVVAAPELSFGGAAPSSPRLFELCAHVGQGVALVSPFVGAVPMLDFVAALKAAAPGFHLVLMMDAHNPHLVRGAVKAGACGLVAHTAQPHEILLALRSAATGRRYIATDMAAHLAESMAVEDLTRREMQVMHRLSQGDCNKAIARLLDVTVGTVKTHVRSIMGKLDSGSRTEAVCKAWQLGLVRPDQ